ncbi:hypothetical protein LKK83_02600 [Phormidium sp. CCY1219]|nr:hypothetical protein [Phormidium sp. CCY1219]
MLLSTTREPRRRSMVGVLRGSDRVAVGDRNLIYGMMSASDRPRRRFSIWALLWVNVFKLWQATVLSIGI